MFENVMMCVGHMCMLIVLDTACCGGNDLAVRAPSLYFVLRQKTIKQ